MEAEQYIDDHSRTIIHIDLDCFYAQVEMNKNPELRTLPVGIQQKNSVVTSNYVARNFGVKKCMPVTEAKKVCQNLVLVNGEDLHDYRQTSYKVTTLLQRYSNLVERLGLDENYIDVSKLVSERIREGGKFGIVGHVFGDNNNPCDCGCFDRLEIGTNIAQEMRDAIKSELQLTSCAGVGHNKLLAKLVGSKHKPDQQTVVFPNTAVELILSLKSASNITGIGVSLSAQLKSLDIQTVEDLHNADFSKLEKLFGSEKAKIVYESSYGLDRTPVKATGKPQSISIEDSCKTISVEKEVREKLRQLLGRLLLLVAEDGRIPRTIKLTVRKFDKNNRFSNRETRQCNINTTLFNSQDLSTLTEANENKIMSTIMRLFSKLVNTNKPYHLTLLGLSFTKFLERPSVKSSLTKFLIKDIEVQSITNIESCRETEIVPDECPSTSYTENVETDPEPSSKKLKVNNLIAKNHLTELDDCASPSKLRVAELRLNSTEKPTDDNQNITCPPNASEEVFRELPRDVQRELWEEYRQNRERDKVSSSQMKRTKPNSILNYLVKR